MLKLRGLSAISVTATPARTALPDTLTPHLLYNAGTSSLYYRYDPDVATSTLAGIASVILAAGGSELPAGQTVTIPAGAPWLDIACATGLTATGYVRAGAVVGTPLGATAAGQAAILATIPTATLAITTITVTAASATIQALLTTAGGAMNANTKRITLQPAADISLALGAAAVAGTNVLPADSRHELLCLAATDLRLIAAGNVSCVVFQEG